jgi:hypothetical protein
VVCTQRTKERKQELWLLNLVIKLVAFDEDTNWGLDEKMPHGLDTPHMDWY